MDWCMRLCHQWQEARGWACGLVESWGTPTVVTVRHDAVMMDW